jgi:hypothetical protein
MRFEYLGDERLDEVLRRQPRWEPPRTFARAVIARMPVVVPASLPRRRSLPVVFRAAAVGALGASLTYAAGMLIVWATAGLIPGALTAAAAYEMLLDVATALLIDHAAIIGWISAAVMLSIAASVTGLGREWI